VREVVAARKVVVTREVARCYVKRRRVARRREYTSIGGRRSEEGAMVRRR
jgi:hypothetical protein